MEKYFNDKGIFQYKIVSTDVIPFSETVREACAANYCGRYGTCWTCPPGVGEWQQLEKQIKEYKNAAVFTMKYQLEDSFDIEGMDNGSANTRDTLCTIIEQMQNDGIKLLALGCGSCNICPECTYPDNPCRFPEKAIPSIEACGINVVQLAKKIGVNYHNGNNTVTYFCAIFY